MGVERRETPQDQDPRRDRPETPWDHEPRPRPEPPGGLSLRAKIAAGAFIAILYAGGMGFRGDWFPGIVVGILNTYEHFTVPALTPVFWNAAIIAGLVVGVPAADGSDRKLYVYAASILVGTVIQVLLPLPWLRMS